MGRQEDKNVVGQARYFCIIVTRARSYYRHTWRNILPFSHFGIPPTTFFLWTRSRGFSPPLSFSPRCRIVRMRQAALIHHGTRRRMDDRIVAKFATYHYGWWYIYFGIDPSKLYVVSWKDRDREWKKKKCMCVARNKREREREIAVAETLTQASLFFAIFFLTHCLSSRHVGDRPFPGSTCSVRPCLVITSLLPSNDASSSFFSAALSISLSLSLDALVCRWGARVANSSHERDRLRQYRAAIVYRFPWSDAAERCFEVSGADVHNFRAC